MSCQNIAFNSSNPAPQLCLLLYWSLSCHSPVSSSAISISSVFQASSMFYWFYLCTIFLIKIGLPFHVYVLFFCFWSAPGSLMTTSMLVVMRTEKTSLQLSMLWFGKFFRPALIFLTSNFLLCWILLVSDHTLSLFSSLLLQHVLPRVRYHLHSQTLVPCQ